MQWPKWPTPGSMSFCEFKLTEALGEAGECADDKRILICTPPLKTDRYYLHLLSQHLLVT